ncbi:hypothetical protein GCM10027614_05490 [Micromonospora vulcania]
MPGARVVVAQVIGPRLAFDDGGVCVSVTVTPVSVNPPVFTTWNTYGTCCPTVLIVAVVEVFVMSIEATRPVSGMVSVEGGESIGAPPPGGCRARCRCW